MSVKTRRPKTEQPVPTVQEWLTSMDLSFAQADLVAALAKMHRQQGAADLPARDRDFWDQHSGITSTPHDIAKAAADNAAARVLMDSSALTAAEVADRMRLSASTIRHNKAARKLYSYLVNGRLLFPSWQFMDAGNKAIPFLEDVLKALPANLHPQSVSGFFLTPQPDLVLNGEAVSAKAWLESGGDVAPVIELAQSLAASY